MLDEEFFKIESHCWTCKKFTDLCKNKTFYEQVN